MAGEDIADWLPQGVPLLQPSLEVGYPNDLTDFFCFSSFLPTPFKHIISVVIFCQ
jgi:hypothetical protein